jgi:hypothetical protein
VDKGVDYNRGQPLYAILVWTSSLCYTPMQPLTNCALLTCFPKGAEIRPLPLFLPYPLTCIALPAKTWSTVTNSHTPLPYTHHRRRQELPRHAIAVALSDPTIFDLDLVHAMRAQFFSWILLTGELDKPYASQYAHAGTTGMHLSFFSAWLSNDIANKSVSGRRLDLSHTKCACLPQSALDF